MDVNHKIDRAAIFHLPCSEYAFAGTEHSLTVRLRAARGNLTRCTLYYDDRASRKVFCGRAVPMEMVAEDGCHTYFEATVEDCFARMGYYFKLEAPEESLYYAGGCFSAEKPCPKPESAPFDGRSGLYQYPYILRSELAAVPEWFKAARVYNIFPDSFASGKSRITEKGLSVTLPDGTVCRSRLGGTLQGITENLAYIHGLGIDCLYLNPIFTAESYHKYDLMDYFHVDPCLGTDEDLKTLVNAAHGAGMRVLLDGVFNHTSDHFFAFRDVKEKGKASPYYGWYYDVPEPCGAIGADGTPSYACFAYVGMMPKLDTANPAVQAYFARVGSYWIEKFDVDGWRLDVANEVSKEFWRTFKRAVRAAKSDAVLIGEVWENARDWIGYDLFDSAMDYGFRDACRDFFAAGRTDAAAFDAAVTELRMRYPDAYWRAQLNLLDSHDVPRFLSFCGGDRRRMKLAIVFQMLFPGVPSVFYGDEYGMDGVAELDFRKPMPWGSADTELLDFYRSALALHTAPAVQKGRWRTLSAEIGSCVYGFSLESPEQTLEVWLNAGPEAAAVPMGTGRLLAGAGAQSGNLAPMGWAVMER